MTPSSPKPHSAGTELRYKHCNITANEPSMLHKQTFQDHLYSNVRKTGFHKTFWEARPSAGNQRQGQAHAKCSPTKLLTP